MIAIRLWDNLMLLRQRRDDSKHIIIREERCLGTKVTRLDFESRFMVYC